MTSPEPLDNAQQARSDLAALEAALASGRATALDPGERELQTFALALRAAAPRPRAEFNELLDRQIREQLALAALDPDNGSALAEPVAPHGRSRGDDGVVPIEVVVAHGRPRTDAAIGALLRESDIAVIGQVDDGTAALEQARRLRPDVIVLDSDGPGGEVVLKRLREGVPGTPIVVVGPDEDAESLLAAISAGGLGYVSRGTIAQELGRAVRTIHGDEAFVSPQLARHLLRGYEQKGTGAGLRRPVLTSREAQVLRALARDGDPRRTAGPWCSPSRAAVLAPGRHGSARWWRLRLERWSAAFRASGGGSPK